MRIRNLQYGRRLVTKIYVIIIPTVCLMGLGMISIHVEWFQI